VKEELPGTTERAASFLLTLFSVGLTILCIVAVGAHNVPVAATTITLSALCYLAAHYLYNKSWEK